MFGGPLNLTLSITPDIANGEIGFTSNATVVVYEPEDSNTSTVRYGLRYHYWYMQVAEVHCDNIVVSE